MLTDMQERLINRLKYLRSKGQRSVKIDTLANYLETSNAQVGAMLNRASCKTRIPAISILYSDLTEKTERCSMRARYPTQPRAKKARKPRKTCDCI